LEPPDAQEKRIRFGCGFIFGLVTAGVSSVSFLLANRYYIAALCLFAGFLFGFAAVKYGDEFWYKLGKYWWWPWW
jgi:hypothetical protein